jgi:F-type H+-transporting ATPase subunit epsilon
MSGTFELSVVTPEREVLACAARFVALPAYDGEIGILPRRAALLTQLGSGTLRVEEASGARRSLFVSGGFAQMAEGKLTLLTEEARAPEAVTPELARAASAAAAALPRATDAEAEKRWRAAARARALARLARAGEPR